ncbi:hypothetical protein RJ641_012888 [Dillenia turbinata]|uniref:Uncharacterized protein n=1 Tax=Dillenia turbinata TaxID=194707 RepID=A0AAN8Z2N4_9MAGN
MTKRVAMLAKPAMPFICALLYLWLTLLAFADDRILTLENKTETLFPPGRHLFNKIDELVCTVETLPEKFDDLVYRFPTIVHQIPPLDWALSIVISWLNLLVTVLNNLGSDRTREKEIMVDVSCNVEDNADESMKSLSHLSDGNSEIFCGASSDAPEEDNKANGVAAECSTMRCSYKEALVQGANDQSSENENAEEIEKPVMGTVIKSNDGKDEDVPILELFESGWHMTPKKGASKRKFYKPQQAYPGSSNKIPLAQKPKSMFSLPNMLSTTSVLSIYTTFAASAMLVRTKLKEVQTLTNQLLPQQLRQKILSMIGDPFGKLPSDMTLVINEYNGYTPNEVYQAAEQLTTPLNGLRSTKLRRRRASQLASTMEKLCWISLKKSNSNGN